MVEGKGRKVEDRSIEIIQSKKEWEKKSGKISKTSEAWQFLKMWHMGHWRTRMEQKKYLNILRIKIKAFQGLWKAYIDRFKKFSEPQTQQIRRKPCLGLW